jgi:hypothetical protein
LIQGRGSGTSSILAGLPPDKAPADAPKTTEDARNGALSHTWQRAIAGRYSDELETLFVMHHAVFGFGLLTQLRSQITQGRRLVARGWRATFLFCDEGQKANAGRARREIGDLSEPSDHG